MLVISGLGSSTPVIFLWLIILAFLPFFPLSKDITDLFGADLPVEGGKGGEFAWRDGPLLAALKAGHWVVLDEVRASPGQGHLLEKQSCFP